MDGQLFAIILIYQFLIFLFKWPVDVSLLEVSISMEHFLLERLFSKHLHIPYDKIFPILMLRRLNTKAADFLSALVYENDCLACRDRHVYKITG